MNNYDVIIIGGGPGGYHAASLMAGSNKKILLIEKQMLGGTCLNWGCIPTKTLLNIAKNYSYADELKDMGLITNAEYNHELALNWKNKVVNTLQSGVQSLLKKSKVDILNGEAVITQLKADSKIIACDEKEYEAKNVIIASGLESFIPPIQGIENDNVVTSTEILSLKEVPNTLAIVGGGVIGIEFASIFSQLGSKVYVIEALPRILSMMEKDGAEVLQKVLTSQGIVFHCNSMVEKIDNNKLEFTDDNGKKNNIDFNKLLISVGRKTNLQNFKNLGLDISNTGIIVNEQMQTNISGVYAIGDVVGNLQLAHVAYRMAEVAVDTINGKNTSMSYKCVPSVVYTNPEFASCGISEDDAKKQKIDVIVACVPITMSGRVIAEHGVQTEGFCKIIADAQNYTILGIHVVGPMASEIISAASVIISAQLRVQELAEIIFPHPTVGEVLHNVSLMLLQKIRN